MIKLMLDSTLEGVEVVLTFFDGGIARSFAATPTEVYKLWACITSNMEK